MIAAALVLVLSGPAFAGAPMHEIAVRVSAAARRAGVARVAVLPLEARGAGGAADGEALSDALTGEVVRDGRVRVVERSRLSDLMSERRLETAGATAASVSETRLSSAQAVLTGSFTRRGGKMHASVRLVHAETGEILAAVEESFDWESSADAPPSRGESWTMVVPPPAFTVAVPELGDEPLDFKDAPNDDECAGAGARVDAIVAGILDVKARYWASELRKGFSPYAVTRNPGSEISDPALKARFYETMKGWFQRGFIPELSGAEFERMRREDARAAALAGRCGI
jgi:TolB-like protein